MCSHKTSLWTPRRTCGLTCLHGISCGASPPLYQPPLDLQAHRHNNPWCSPPRAPPATPWCSPSWAPAATPTPPARPPGRPPMPIQPGLPRKEKSTTVRSLRRSRCVARFRSFAPPALTRTRTDLTPPLLVFCLAPPSWTTDYGSTHRRYQLSRPPRRSASPVSDTARSH